MKSCGVSWGVSMAKERTGVRREETAVETDLVERLGGVRVREREVQVVGVDVLPEIEREGVRVLEALHGANLISQPASMSLQSLRSIEAIRENIRP